MHEERVNAFRELAMDYGLVRGITVNDDLQSCRGRYYSDRTIKIREGCSEFHKTIAHEVAHSLESSRFGYVDPDVMDKLDEDATIELEYLHRIEDNDGRNKLNEKFVNTVSWVVTHPTVMREKYPNLVQEFENRVVTNATGNRRELLERVVNDQLV